MKKKIVILIIICLLGISLLLIIKTVNRIDNKKQIEKNVSTLPELIITSVDNCKINITSIVNDKPLILIAFNTECDMCHNEIQSILDNINRFDKYKIVMISSEPIDSIINFQKKYKLDNFSNISLGNIDDIYAYQELGIEIIPQIFIYNSNKKLLKVYKGETKLDAILKYLD